MLHRTSVGPAGRRHPQSRCGQPPPASLSVLALVCAAVLFCAPALPGRTAPVPKSLEQLRKDLAEEQKYAEVRKLSLQRMTAEERKLNADLAAAEKRILALESNLASERGRMLELGTAGEKVRLDYERLLDEQKKTEAALTRTLRLLWEIDRRRAAGVDAPDREQADDERDFAWSGELYAALEQYRKKLDSVEIKLADAVGRREKLSGEMQRRMASVNAEKSNLLKARLAYDKRLADIRRRRGDAESELNAALKLISSLNFEISRRSGGDLPAMKGRLPRPVNGSVKVRFHPDAEPISRGLGFAAAEKAEVRAVAGGKVVHNDVLRGFGTVLIVQHGTDYYTLYAFLGTCPLKVGQEVQERQKVGTAGYYPAIKGPGLYFELRFKQKAINPEPWLASS
ncbi:MAG: peptidoglycan DD-metalloendopeptidase family protein [Desulfovibrio sp.]|jgi:septal ring factor EnvC (AmiA/AmiB activator)|nr:peptidoglycan DD-metalloendopeptidase family protein [Desulfovibrio sp.]